MDKPDAASVLIVDDDEAIREAMAEFMEMAGYRAATAETAENALKSLAKEPFDVVVADILMPGMNGLELTDKIKRRFDADVIVMTGYSADYSYEEAIGKGASDFVFKPVRFEELLLRLKRVLNERRLARDREKMLAELQKLAITDGLTGLYNSRHFYAQLEMEVSRAERYNALLSLLLLDIDHFKDYNDAHGHLEGDKVLNRLAQTITACLRKNDTAYRYGGEEFTVILPETACDEAVKVAERIRNSVAALSFSPQHSGQVSMTVSVGATQYIPGEAHTALVKRADQAMYLSKQNGRNRVTPLFSEATA